MKFSRIVGKYLTRYAVENRWSLVSASTDGIDNVVVIPALAESKHIFETLASLSRNPESELQRTLVICVVNNMTEGNSSSCDIKDNKKTLNILQSIIGKGKLKGKMTDLRCHLFLNEIKRNSLRLALVDASSPGNELPESKAGVGMARKIGCDKALRLFDYDTKRIKLIFSLDADTIVEKNYLTSVRDCFENTDCVALVISYAHRYPERREERAAIICYEIFLRYYVMGLEYARSKYAFHSIGSAMAFTAEGYACVRGMNRRKAGEDFYFLNKLAKVGDIVRIDKTRVFPSPRISERVPFGTGKRVGRFLTGDREEYLLYDPSVFEVVKAWLSFMPSSGNIGLNNILSRAREIHPELEVFLEMHKFREIWPRLVRNSGSDDNLKNSFNCWFDGFKTMKLINHLTRNEVPPTNMFTALKILFAMKGEQPSLNIEKGVIPSMQDQEKILDYMRSICQ